jgi:hypothetical protein
MKSMFKKHGYNLSYTDLNMSYYIRFGKCTIMIEFNNKTNKYQMKHDDKYPTNEMIEQKVAEIMFKDNNINFIISEITMYIETIKPEEKESNEDKFSIILPLEIPHNKDRELKVIVWGKRKRKFCPPQYKIERNFNACILGHGDKSGVDWRKDGRKSEAVRRSVMKGPRFYDFMGMVVKRIEVDNLHIIGVNCAKGRHRSATTAIVLQTFYYMKTDIVFLEI